MELTEDHIKDRMFGVFLKFFFLQDCLVEDHITECVFSVELADGRPLLGQKVYVFSRTEKWKTTEWM